MPRVSSSRHNRALILPPCRHHLAHPSRRFSGQRTACARRASLQASVALQLPNIPEFLIAHLASTPWAVMCTVHMLTGGRDRDDPGAQRREALSHAAYPFEKLEAGEPLLGIPGDARDRSFCSTPRAPRSPKAVRRYRTMLGNSRLGAQEHGLTARCAVLCPAPFLALYGLYSLHCACPSAPAPSSSRVQAG